MAMLGLVTTRNLDLISNFRKFPEISSLEKNLTFWYWFLEMWKKENDFFLNFHEISVNFQKFPSNWKYMEISDGNFRENLENFQREISAKEISPNPMHTLPIPSLQTQLKWQCCYVMTLKWQCSYPLWAPNGTPGSFFSIVLKDT